VRILAFDPEVASPAYAIVEDGEVLQIGKCPRRLKRGKSGSFSDNYTDRVREVLGLAHAVGVEGQYLPRGEGRNVKSFERLVEVRAELMMLAREAGLECFEISPSEWQAAVLHCHGHARREARKRMALRVARAVMNQSNNIDHHIADAVCMALFLERRLKSKELISHETLSR